MNTPLAKLKRIAILLAGISAASISTAAQADWSIIGLGIMGGPYNRTPSINDSGQVAGFSLTADDDYFHAFITGPNGVGMTDLGIFDSFANDINDSGQVVGFSRAHAFITGPDGIGMTDLGTLGGFVSIAYGINDFGQVVGGSHIANGSSHAFITGSNGIGMTDLGTLGGYSSSAFAINDSGEVVGTALTTDDQHAFLFSHGGMTDLSLLDVVVSGGWSDLRVEDINNNG